MFGDSTLLLQQSYSWCPGRLGLIWVIGRLTRSFECFRIAQVIYRRGVGSICSMDCRFWLCGVRETRCGPTTLCALTCIRHCSLGINSKLLLRGTYLVPGYVVLFTVVLKFTGWRCLGLTGVSVGVLYAVKW